MAAPLQGQALVDALAEHIKVAVEVVSNHAVDMAVAQGLGADWCAAHTMKLTLLLEGAEPDRPDPYGTPKQRQYEGMSMGNTAAGIELRRAKVRRPAAGLRCPVPVPLPSPDWFGVSYYWRRHRRRRALGPHTLTPL